MNRIIVSALLALAAAAALAPSALADTPGCITRAEYRAVHVGDPARRVHRIFDTDGWLRSGIVWFQGYGSQVRQYRPCRPGSRVVVQYEKKPGGLWRVVAKAAEWARAPAFDRP